MQELTAGSRDDSSHGRGFKDDRVMDGSRGWQGHGWQGSDVYRGEVSSGSDSDLMMNRLELWTQDLNGSPAQCASSSSHCQSLGRGSRCIGLAGMIHSLQAVGIPGMASPSGSCTTHKESSISCWDHGKGGRGPTWGEWGSFPALGERTYLKMWNWITRNTMQMGKIGLLRMGKLEKQMEILNRMLK